MTERRYRTLFALSVAYFVVATLANAIAYVARIDARALAFRSFDFAWELGLPWRAAHGEWVGRDFSYPIGPLWQLLALIGSTGRPGSLARTLGGIHVVFPLVSFGICAGIAFRTFADWKRRAIAFFLLALLAGYDDAKSLRSVASLAIVVAYVPLGEGELDTKSAWKRSLAVGAMLAGFTLLSFEIGFLALSSLLFAAGFEAWTTRRYPIAGARLGRALGAVAVSTVVLTIAWSLAGGSFISALQGWLHITRTYSIAMIERPYGWRLGPVAAFGVASLSLCAFIVRQARDRTSAMWIGATLPLVGRAVVRSDAEHIYAALMPLAAALALVGLRAVPDNRTASPAEAKSRSVAAWALLILAAFSFGWFGGHREFPVAWHPAGFVEAARVLWADGAERPGDEVDITRIERWAKQKVAEEHVACIGLPERASVVHPLADVRGPTATSLRWTPSLKEELASEIERSKCPYFVREIVSFDFGPPFQNHAFGQDFLAISRWYEPGERLGPSIFAAKLRPSPVSFHPQDLVFPRLGEARPSAVPGEIAYRLPIAIPSDHLLVIDYTLDVPWASRVIARLPWVHVRFADEAGTIGEDMVLGDLDVDRRTTAVIPVNPEIAEWRWVAGARFAEQRTATRIAFHFKRPTFAPSGVRFTLHSAKALAPPTDSPPSTSTGPEVTRLDLLEPIRDGRRFARGTEARVARDSLALPPNEPNTMLAEVYVPIRPAPGSCLFSELGVEGAGKGDGVWFEIHVIDGAARPRLLYWHNLPGVAPRPAELPLDRWAGRDILLRFGTLPGKDTLGDDAHVYRPRIGPCSARENLIHSFHDGRIRAIRGSYQVLGDTLELELPPQYQPPTEVRAPIQIEPGSCLALDMRAEGTVPGEAVAIDAGILEDRIYDRLAREEMEPGTQRRHTDLSLAEWEGKSVELRITAWRHAPGARSYAVVARARVHRCGDGAPWGFGVGAQP